MTDLASCEQIIAANLTNIRRGFAAIGEALRTIHQNNLWKPHYSSFAEYCKLRWDIDASYAHRLMDAAEVIQRLLPIGNGPLNEAQARELARLDAELQAPAWQLVLDTAPGGKVTAAHIRSVVQTLRDLVVTGAVDMGTGDMVRLADALRAPITEETYERMQRQIAHIQARQSPDPRYITEGTVTAVDASHVTFGVTEPLDMLKPGQSVKIIVYIKSAETAP